MNAWVCNWHAIVSATGLLLYILDGKQIPLFGPSSTTMLPHDWFFVIHNTFTLVGDSVSRKIMYVISPKHPWWYLILSFAGAAMLLSKIAIIGTFSMRVS